MKKLLPYLYAIVLLFLLPTAIYLERSYATWLWLSQDIQDWLNILFCFIWFSIFCYSIYLMWRVLEKEFYK